MDKILEVGEVFGASSFNPVLLIPVVFVVIGAIAVFVFGFERSQSPKFRKLGESSTSTNSGGSLKRKKRGAAEAPLTASVGAGKTGHQQAPSQNAHATQQQRSGKKEATGVAKLASSVSPAAGAKKSSSSGKQSGTATTHIAASTPSKNAPKSKSVGKGGANNSKQTVASPADKSNDGEGEWKTVVTKKQKQKQSADPLLQAVAEVAAVAAKSGKSSAKSPAAGSPMKKKDNAKAKGKSASSAVPTPESATFKPEQKSAIAELDMQAEVQSIVVDAVDAISAAPVAATAEADATVAFKDDVEVSAPAGSNVVFDELGDAAWTETKPQKRNKKRALRE